MKNRTVVIPVIFFIILAASIIYGVWRYSARYVSLSPLQFITPEDLETLTIKTDTTLTEDYFNTSIVIGADGVTLDGDGHMIIGPGPDIWIRDPDMGYYIPTIGILLEGRTSVTVKNCRVTNFVTGFSVFCSDGNTFMNNAVYENVNCGFLLTFSSNNTLMDNTAYGNRDVVNNYDGAGFVAEMSFGNSFKGNVAYDNGRGFQVSEFEREIFEGERGFTTEEYEGNIFEENTAEANTEAGFWIGGIDNSFSNTFFHNNLIDNAIQADVQTDSRGWDNANTWDDGYLSGGNYWSDYIGADANCDGIGDTPYVINEDNVDRFPLMAPMSVFNDGMEGG